MAFNHALLKKSREENKLTHTELMFELAKHGLRVSRSTLINWELGRTEPKVSDVYAIAKLFKIRLEKFLTKEVQSA
jgi:DNA-binding XRE family transcriptional regulator